MADPSTDQRELSGLYCIWETLSNNNPPPQDQRVFKVGDLVSIPPGVEQIWPIMNENLPNAKKHDLWTLQQIGPAFKKYLTQDKEHGFSNFSQLEYGVFQGDERKDISLLRRATGGKMSMTTIYDDIWNNCFDHEHRQLFKGKKDSWNPTDGYIFQGDKPKILREICEVKERYDKTNPNFFVLYVNKHLRSLFDKNILIGISLKMGTWPNVPKVKTFNQYCDNQFQPVQAGSGSITGKMHQYMQFENKGGKGSFDSKGNSFKFFANASFDGSKEIKYFWESKSPTQSTSHSTEMKDMVYKSLEPGSPLGPAKAKGGQIPVPEFYKLIADYTNGEDINDRIPKSQGDGVNSGFSPGTDVLKEEDIKYWADQITAVKASPLTNLSDLGIKIPKNPDTPSGVRSMPNQIIAKKPYDWVYTLVQLDSHDSNWCFNKYGVEKGAKFRRNFRGKLRVIRYMKAIMNANQKGELGDFLIRAYFTAGKIKLNKDDLLAPYCKIQ